VGRKPGEKNGSSRKSRPIAANRRKIVKKESGGYARQGKLQTDLINHLETFQVVAGIPGGFLG